MGTTNLRSSQHFHNLQIDQMADRRQKAQDKPGRNILNRPVAGPRGIPTTLWAILDMGRHQEVLTAVLPHLVEAWALRVLVRTAATPGMVWPAPRGSDLRLVLFQHLRYADPMQKYCFDVIVMRFVHTTFLSIWCLTMYLILVVFFIIGVVMAFPIK